MINSTDILSAWQRMGWLEPSESGYTGILDVDNKATLSGKYFDALHPLAGFKKVKDTYPEVNATPTILNAHLKAWQQTGILTVCGDVFLDQVTQGTLLEGEIDFDDLLTGSNFVFVRIVVPKGHVLIVRSVGLTLDSVATVPVYVFNSSKLAALNAASLTNVTTVANTETWALMNYSLWGESLSSKNGIYYVGYFQTALGTAQSIQRNFYGKMGPCRFDYCQATPNGVSLPSEDNVVYTGNTHGLNIDYVIRRDYSEYYLNSPDLFDKALGYYVIIQLLKQILLTDRQNSNQRKGSEIAEASQILLELNGSTGLSVGSEVMVSKGLNQLYLDEIQLIKDIINRKYSKLVTII